MKFYDLLKVIENLENDDIRQTAASELEKIIRVAEPTMFIYFMRNLLKYPDGVAAVKSQFEEMKKAIFQYVCYGTLPNTLAMFFRLIELFEDIPELQEEYESYNFFGQLHKNTLEAEVMKNHPDAHLVRLIERYAMLDIVLSEDIKEIKSVIDKWSGENNLIFCGAGKNTLVFSAGEIVIKIGNKENFSIPYHPRILMPYFRKQYNQGLTIEVCDSVKVEEDAEITDKELLEFYKELEKAGIFWGDPKKVNLGRLKRANRIPTSVEDLVSVGFIENPRYPISSIKQMKSGDIILFDLDLLYLLSNPNRQIVECDEVVKKYLEEKERM